MSVAAAGLSAAIGVWLMVAPAVLGYGDPAASVHRIAGPVAAAFGTIALWRVVRAVLRANVVVGVSIVAAVALGGPADATANALACAVALTALALVPIPREDHFAGGWIGLFRERSG